MDILKKRLDANDILAYTIMLIPVWWILGVKFFVFQIASFFIVLKVLKKNSVKDKNLKLSIIGIGIYACSILIALLQNNLNVKGFDLMSPLYLLSYWIMGLFIIVGIHRMNYNKNTFLKLLKSFLVVGVVTIVLFVIGRIMWGNNEFMFADNGVFYKILPENLKISFFEQLTKIQFVWRDWINGISSFRLNAFYIYPTANAIGTLVVIVYSLLYLSLNNSFIISTKNQTVNKMITVLYIVLLGLGLYLARSRMVIAASILGVVIVLVLYLINKNNWKKVFYITLGVTIMAILIILSLDLIQKVLMMREGSNSERLKIYKASLETFTQYPIFGVGVRYFIPESYIPVGSHSTYLGVLMRSGIVGFIGITLFLVNVVIRIIKNKSLITDKNMRNIWLATSYLFIVMSIWMITDDIDWPSIVALFYFINIGFIFKFKSMNFNSNAIIE